MELSSKISGVAGREALERVKKLRPDPVDRDKLDDADIGSSPAARSKATRRPTCPGRT